jgi:outer membrane protein OmpA-like peptidoglycan-associated protein
MLCWTASAQIDQLPNIKAGVNVGAYIAGEEFTRSVEDYTFRPALSLYIEYPFASRYGFSGSLVGGIISKDVTGIQLMDPSYPFDKLSYKTTVIGTIVGPYYRIPIVPNVFSTNVHANLGLFSRITTGRKDGAYFTDPVTAVVTWGLGISSRYSITPSIAAQISYNGFLTNSDELDGFGSGQDRDGFSHFSFGLVWNLYDDRMDDLPYDPYAEDTEDVLNRANETIERRSEGTASWESDVDQTEVEANEGVLTYTSLELSQFRSLQDLEREESRLILTLDKLGRASLPVEIGFELVKDDRIVAQGVKTLTIMQRRSALSSREFVDFRGLNVMPGFNGTLPDGNYELRVIVEDLRTNEKSVNEISFYKVNMERLFGDNTDDIQDLIDDNKASLVPSKDGGEVLIKVLPENGKPLAADTKESTDLQQSEDGDLNAIYQETELESAVSKSFDIALGIQNKLVQEAEDNKKPVILLAEIYFEGKEETYLDEADKKLLLSIARRMRSHPQIRMELRGVADEFNDKTRAKELAEVRAVRVMDSLSRLLVPGYRLSVSGTPVASGMEPSGEQMSNLENRKVSIVMTVY